MRNINVKQLLALSQSRIPVVSKDATVGEVVEKLIEDRDTHVVYVADEDGRCHGVIPLRQLAHHAFLHEVPDKPSATDMLEKFSVESAADLCLQEPIFVHEDDTIEQLLNVMFSFKVDEIAVVDEEERIIGNIHMLDLIQDWHEGRLDGIKE